MRIISWEGIGRHGRKKLEMRKGKKREVIKFLVLNMGEEICKRVNSISLESDFSKHFINFRFYSIP